MKTVEGKNRYWCHICKEWKVCPSQIVIPMIKHQGVLIKPLAIRLCDSCSKWLSDMLAASVKRAEV